MLWFANDTTTSVTVEHFPGDALVVASFDWTIAQPEDTYTIDAQQHLSLELDRHFPVRLARITLTDPQHVASVTTLERLVGEELAAAMQAAPLVGFSALQSILTSPQRLAIANIQAGSPSTPGLLRKSCNGILRAALLTPADHNNSNQTNLRVTP